jgi:hypothetical protein
VTDQAQRIDRPYLLVEPKPVLVKTRASEPPPPPAELEQLPPIPVAPCNRDPEEVIRVVGFAYSISVERLKSNDRHKTLAQAKSVAAWMLRTVTRMSSTEIGDFLGRDHTSVLTAAKVCNKRREADEAFRAFTDELRVAVEARLAVRRKLG